MIREKIVVAAVGLLSLVACEKKETPAPMAEAAPVAPPTTAAVPATAAPAEPVVDAASLPVEEQYEAEAEQEVTAENLNAKLDELEKEIAEP